MASTDRASTDRASTERGAPPSSEHGGPGGGRDREQKLARTVSPPLLAVYGLGTILGAGIYVVIGDIVAAAGFYAPLAFLAACLAASFTALSYAELAARIPQSGGPVAYTTEAFGRRWLSIVIGWMIVATGVVSAATIATGFVGYLEVFVDVPPWLVLAGLVAMLTAVASIGMEESAWFMGGTTVAGVAGLVMVLVVAGPRLAELPGRFESLAASPGTTAAWSGLALGTFVAFYAFIGFEDLVHTAEEAEDASRALPLAIFFSLGVATLFYVVVSAVAVATLDPATLAASPAPLVAVVEAVLAGDGASLGDTWTGRVLGGLSLLIIVNGALAQLIMASRTIFDLGERRGGAPAVLVHVSSTTRTPVRATLLCGAVVLALALFFPTGDLARGTSFVMLLVFFASNLSLIVLDRRGGEPETLASYPDWVPWVGAILCLALLAAELFVGGGGHG